MVALFLFLRLRFQIFIVPEGKLSILLALWL
jgi:hypothetical protein